MKEKKREKWTRAKSATGSSQTQKTSLDFKSFLGFRAREACRSAVMENQKKKKRNSSGGLSLLTHVGEQRAKT